ncbi:MAG: M20 family metallopeptidase [Tissierellales bacterium]|nr:M20 family metallopeptidase [Tissierellales bacterium]
MKSIDQHIEKISEKLISMADYIFDNPEIGLVEFKASKLLCDFLEENEFVVERGIADLPTAFRATYKSGKGGLRLGLFCEYDALDGLGHACAHHLQGPIVIGAALAVKESIKDKDYEIVIYGAPAEETVSGKLTMLKKGYCQDMDVAMMVHGAPTTSIDKKALALGKYRVTFKGKAAHAASNPEKGRSAFDAALLMFHGIESMREHLTDDARIHYTVTNSIGAANIVPALCVTEIYVRSDKTKSLEGNIEWFFDIVKGAAMMTQTSYEIFEIKKTDSRIPVFSLNEIIMKNAELYKAPTIRPPREKTGSSDFSNVMYNVPGACLRFAIVAEDASTHSQEFLDAAKTEETHQMIVKTAKIIAKTLNDLIDDPTHIEKIKKEFEENKIKMG